MDIIGRLLLKFKVKEKKHKIRMCHQEGCNTILNSHNTGKYCEVHKRNGYNMYIKKFLKLNHRKNIGRAMKKIWSMRKYGHRKPV